MGTDTKRETVQLVVFEINQALYGLPVSKVQEVINFSAITHTPGALESLEGVIDVRGDIIPVVDLHKRFRLPVPPSFQGCKILITEIRDFIVGFIVDKVNEVTVFPFQDVAPPPPGITQPGCDFTVGIIQKKGRLLLYLEVERLIDLDQLLGKAPI